VGDVALRDPYGVRREAGDLVEVDPVAGARVDEAVVDVTRERAGALDADIELEAAAGSVDSNVVDMEVRRRIGAVTNLDRCLGGCNSRPQEDALERVGAVIEEDADDVGSDAEDAYVLPRTDDLDPSRDGESGADLVGAGGDVHELVRRRCGGVEGCLDRGG